MLSLLVVSVMIDMGQKVAVYRADYEEVAWIRFKTCLVPAWYVVMLAVFFLCASGHADDAVMDHELLH